MPPPPSLTGIAARVDQRISTLLTAERQRWTAFDADIEQPIAEIERLVLAGGKRLRPAFCHWGYVAAGGDPEAGEVDDLGGALELMHAFALFHDDVMDDAASRRGAPTTHVVFAAEHRRASWAGEDRRFGEGIAILVGDLAFVFADLLLADASPAVWAVWNELRIELNVGQLLDLIGSVRGDRTLVKAERICRYKSGKYTIER
ncbi:MAG: polyprenyl synthetase family protein, partial [Ilumatobacteraceae bacterium]